MALALAADDVLKLSFVGPDAVPIAAGMVRGPQAAAPLLAEVQRLAAKRLPVAEQLDMRFYHFAADAWMVLADGDDLEAALVDRAQKAEDDLRKPRMVSLFVAQGVPTTKPGRRADVVRPLLPPGALNASASPPESWGDSSRKRKKDQRSAGRAA